VQPLKNLKTFSLKKLGFPGLKRLKLIYVISLTISLYTSETTSKHLSAMNCIQAIELLWFFFETGRLYLELCIIHLNQPVSPLWTDWWTSPRIYQYSSWQTL